MPVGLVFGAEISVKFRLGFCVLNLGLGICRTGDAGTGQPEEALAVLGLGEEPGP